MQIITSMKKWIVRIFLLLLGFILPLAIAELCLRTFGAPLQQVELVGIKDDRTVIDKANKNKEFTKLEEEHGLSSFLDWGEKGVRLKSRIKATIKGHHLSRKDILITTNSIGYRYDELDDKKSDEFRILALGDSITFGDFVDEQDTFTRQMEALLKNRTKTIKVINAGGPGFNTNNEFGIYLETGRYLKPDIVLIGMYLNDAHQSGAFNAKVIPYPYAYSYVLRWFAHNITLVQKYLWNKQQVHILDQEKWQEEFRAGRDLHSGNMYNDKNGFDFEIYHALWDFGLAWNPVSWDIIEKIMVVMKKSADDNGSVTVVALFPIHIQVMGTVPNYFPQEQCKKMCDKLGIPFIDLRPPLAEDYKKYHESLFYDHCHLTPRGYKIVAETLVKELDKYKLLPLSGNQQ